MWRKVTQNSIFKCRRSETLLEPAFYHPFQIIIIPSESLSSLPNHVCLSSKRNGHEIIVNISQENGHLQHHISIADASRGYWSLFSFKPSLIRHKFISIYSLVSLLQSMQSLNCGPSPSHALFNRQILFSSLCSKLQHSGSLLHRILHCQSHSRLL